MLLGGGELEPVAPAVGCVWPLLPSGQRAWRRPTAPAGDSVRGPCSGAERPRTPNRTAWRASGLAASAVRGGPVPGAPAPPRLPRARLPSGCSELCSL